MLSLFTLNRQMHNYTAPTMAS